MAQIDSLPPELLSHIFYLLYENIKASKGLWRDMGRPLITSDLLLVSSHWHQVAITNPSLWTYIPITRRTGSSERARKLVERDLIRSKECSLDIVIHIELPARSSPSESLLKDVAVYAHRWRTLTVHALTAEAGQILEQIYLPHLFSVAFARRLDLPSSMKLNAPNLKMLDGPRWESDSLVFEEPSPLFTEIRYSKSSNSTELLVSHLQRSQNTLKRLSLNIVHPHGVRINIGASQTPPDTPELSFTALTDYAVEFNTRSWNWSVLNIGHMPLLRHLSLYWYIFEDFSSTSKIPFMPQLVSLKVSLDHGRRFKRIASALQSAAPNLERLCLYQTFSSPPTSDSVWLSPLISGDQDNVVAAWPKLIGLRLYRLGIQWGDLKSVAACRPAFKQVSVDSECWKLSKAKKQDADALKESFEVVVTDVDPEWVSPWM